jgi:protein MPE1
MSSAVYYKFKSQRNESRIAIDGTGISVLDLKREIIQANDLGKAMDIDLQVFEPRGEHGALPRLSH